MKKVSLLFVLALLLTLVFSITVAQAANDQACWGQATKVFARMGLVGEHSSSFPTPRLGLANLARAIFGEDGTMQQLGAFVADALGFSIDECM